MIKVSGPIEDYIFMYELKTHIETRAFLYENKIENRIRNFKLEQDRKYFPFLFMQQCGRAHIDKSNYYKLIDMYSDKMIIGITATPKRLSKKEVDKLMNDAINKPNPGYYSKEIKKQSTNLLIQKIIILLLLAFNIFTFWFLFVN